jgi:hypothetical protein
MRIERDMSLGKEDYLFWLFNKFGDYKLCYNFTADDGTQCWSKHISYSTLMAYNYDDYVPDAKMKKEKFIEKVSHRSVFDVEIIFDIDEYDGFLSIKQKTFYLCRDLDKKEIDYSIYFTGNKSYHVSAIFPELRFVSERTKDKMKTEVLKFYKADVQKSKNTMIALEGEKHYKSMKLKTRVDNIESLR